MFWRDTIDTPNSHIWREIHRKKHDLWVSILNFWGVDGRSCFNFYFDMESLRTHSFAIAKSTWWIFEELLFLNWRVLSLEFVLHPSGGNLLGNQATSRSFLNLGESNVFQTRWWLVGTRSFLKDLSSIDGHDFLSPNKTGRYLEGTKRNPGNIISRFPSWHLDHLDLSFFLSGRHGRKDLARSKGITWLFAWSSIREAQDGGVFFGRGDVGTEKHFKK